MADSSQSRTVRLNRYIAQAGICSRREADNVIASGRVQINGRRVYELGIQIDPANDSVKVDGKLIQTEAKKVYFMLHKPRGVMTTMSDPQGRPTVAEYVARVGYRVFPIGRLDWNSEGLLILTNDGAFANKVMHPKFDVTKTYLVKVDGNPSQAQLDKLKRGISIIGGKVKAKAVSFTNVGESDKYKWVRIIITEGKNQQVRRMFEKIGFDVLRLRRVAIGQLKLGSMKAGEIKSLSPRQMDRVFQTDEVSERVEKSAQRREILRTATTSRGPVRRATKKTSSAPAKSRYDR